MAIAAGSLAPDEGLIELGGEPVTGASPAGGAPARAVHRLPAPRPGPRPHRGREHRHVAARAVGTAGAGPGPGTAGPGRLHGRPGPAGGQPQRGPAPAARGGQGAGRRSQGADPGRADRLARRRGDRDPVRRAAPDGRRTGWPWSTSPTGWPRCASCASGSPCCATARCAAASPVAEVSDGQLLELIVGRAVTAEFPPKARPEPRVDASAGRRALLRPRLPRRDADRGRRGDRRAGRHRGQRAGRVPPRAGRPGPRDRPG